MKIREHTTKSSDIFVEEFIPDKEIFSKPLVLVHGSFGGAFMWKMIATQLAENGYHSFAISLRGHMPNKEIDLSEVGMVDYVEDISSVVREFDLQDPVIVGHSMAGLLVLMYAKDNPVSAVISIDPSASVEVQGVVDEEKIKSIPLIYSPVDAGMPTDMMEIMNSLPDISKDILMNMKDMLGMESGKARRDRKMGISIPKESINMPTFFIGAELGSSLPFGIPFETSEKMAKYYDKELVEIKGATHPGILMGEHATEVAEKIAEWLSTSINI